MDTTMPEKQKQFDARADVAAAALQAPAASIAGAAIQCPDGGGSAGAYPCLGVDLSSFTSKADLGLGSQNLNDIWGW